MTELSQMENMSCGRENSSMQCKEEHVHGNGEHVLWTSRHVQLNGELVLWKGEHAPRLENMSSGTRACPLPYVS